MTQTLHKNQKLNCQTYMMWTTAPQPDMASLSTALIRACDIVSNRSSGSRLGSHSASHIPYSCSVHVPATMKSSGMFGQPIRSMLHMNGSNVLGSSPATMGSTKYGPNLQFRINPVTGTLFKLSQIKWKTCTFYEYIQCSYNRKYASSSYLLE